MLKDEIKKLEKHIKALNELVQDDMPEIRIKVLYYELLWRLEQHLLLAKEEQEEHEEN